MTENQIVDHNLRWSWHLVQRLSLRDPDAMTGTKIDQVVSHDYMGSAEFEWGSVPSSWFKLRELKNAGKLRYSSIQLPNMEVPLHVLSDYTDESMIQSQLAYVFSRDYRGKESTYSDYLWDSERRRLNLDYQTKICAWLRISDKDQPWSPMLISTDIELILRISKLLEGSRPPIQSKREVAAIKVKSYFTSDDLRLFDTVKANQKGRALEGKVVEIHDYGITIKGVEFVKHKVEYRSIETVNGKTKEES